MRTPLLLLLFLPGIASANTFTGKVVGVSNGDTITVLRNKKPIKIRLHGVDCPEMKQPYGKKAKQFTSKMVLGKQVRVRVKAKDRYLRTGEVFYRPLIEFVSGKGRQRATGWREGPEASVQEQLVKAGLAWWYGKYDPKNKTLPKLEAAAKKARRGLWADNNPMPPWKWRRGKRSKPLGLLKGTKVGEVHGTAAVDVRNPVTGNVRSKVFHWFTCKHANCTNCRVHFKTIEQAKNAGYRPHRACKPATPQTPKTKRGGGSSACYKACLRRSRPMAMGWEAIKASCRSRCAKKPSISTKRSGSCKRDGDCRLKPCCCSYVALSPGEKLPSRCKPCACPRIYRPSVSCESGACKIILERLAK